MTGIRQVAAFMVVIHHLLPHSGNLWLDRIIKELNVGVTIFFVLSGFLIAYRYYDSFRENYAYSWKYLVSRFARIYPMYFLITLATFFVLYFTGQAGTEFSKVLFLNMTFLRGFSEKYVYTGVSQGWTLTVEETFYFLAPLLFYLINRFNMLRVILPLMITGILAIYFLGLGSMKFIFICTFFGRAFEFFCGIYLAFFISRNNKKPGFPMTIAGGLALLVLICIMAALQTSKYQYGIQNPVGLIVNNLVFPIFTAVFFAGLILERTWVSRLLSTDIFQVLGKSSYVLYLVHYGILDYLIKRYITENVFIVIIIIQIFTIFIWKFIEEPANHYVKHIFLKSKKLAPAIG